VESDAALWQAVYDAPDDDAPRAVLADVLQERGDPRGELIALQLREHRGDASAEASARATQLVKQWGEHWLGALRAITNYAAFKRGCLHQITFANSARSSHWDVLLHDPSFSTVEEIDVRYQDVLFARVLASPASANLRAITINSADGWHGLVEHPPPRLERLSCTTWTQRPGFSMASEYAAGFVDHVLPFVERSPRITTLGLRLEMISQLSPALRARLTGIECEAGWEQALRLWDELPALKSFVVSRPFPNYHLGKIELVRVGEQELVRIDYQGVSWGVTHQQATEALLKLPERFAVLELVGNKQLAKWIRSHHGARFNVIARPAPSSASYISVRA
jgi:uncharacterized protein (TIGR02996 family)